MKKITHILILILLLTVVVGCSPQKQKEDPVEEQLKKNTLLSQVYEYSKGGYLERALESYKVYIDTYKPSEEKRVYLDNMFLVSTNFFTFIFLFKMSIQCKDLGEFLVDIFYNIACEGTESYSPLSRLKDKKEIPFILQHRLSESVRQKNVERIKVIIDALNKN